MTEEDEKMDMANMCCYFWQETGDLERWAGWNRIKIQKYYPEILKCWDDYKTARKILSTVIEKAGEDVGPDF